MLKQLLEQLGLEAGRVRLEWVSAAEGDKWARICTEFIQEIKDLGPLNWNAQFVEQGAEPSAQLEEATA